MSASNRTSSGRRRPTAWASWACNCRLTMTGSISYATSARYRMHHPVPQLAFLGVLSDETGRAQLGDARDKVVGHVRQQYVLCNPATHCD
jgi:hypothetical protein